MENNDVIYGVISSKMCHFKMCCLQRQALLLMCVLLVLHLCSHKYYKHIWIQEISINHFSIPDGLFRCFFLLLWIGGNVTACFFMN